MTYRIFISYATGDENSVKEIYETLSRLEDIKVYISEHGQNIENVGQKIKESLDRSNLVIVLITFNSTNTMWLNQEIGYASGKNMPIISIVEKGIDVEGFLKGQSHIVFQRGDFKYNAYQVVSEIRKKLFQCLNIASIHFVVTCPSCNKKQSEALLSQEDMDAKIQQSQKLRYQCKFCSKALYVDPMNLEVQTN